MITSGFQAPLNAQPPTTAGNGDRTQRYGAVLDENFTARTFPAAVLAYTARYVRRHVLPEIDRKWMVMNSNRCRAAVFLKPVGVVTTKGSSSVERYSCRVGRIEGGKTRAGEPASDTPPAVFVGFAVAELFQFTTSDRVIALSQVRGAVRNTAWSWGGVDTCLR